MKQAKFKHQRNELIFKLRYLKDKTLREISDHPDVNILYAFGFGAGGSTNKHVLANKANYPVPGDYSKWLINKYKDKPILVVGIGPLPAASVNIIGDARYTQFSQLLLKELGPAVIVSPHKPTTFLYNPQFSKNLHNSNM